MLKRQGRGKNLDPKLGRQVAHLKSPSYKTELGGPDGEEVFLPRVGTRCEGTASRGSEGKPLLASQAAWPASNAETLVFSPMCLLFEFTRKFPNRASSFLRNPREFTLEARVVRRARRQDGKPALLRGDKRFLFPTQACALHLPALRRLKSPGSHFCGRFHLVSQGLEEGAVGATWQGPPVSHVRSNLQTALGGSPSPAPNRLLLLPALSAGIRRFSPQLTCLRVARCEKLETKMVSPDGGGAFLYRKEGNTSVGFYFFSPPSSSKKYKETLSLMRMSALNLLGLD